LADGPVEDVRGVGADVDDCDRDSSQSCEHLCTIEDAWPIVSRGLGAGWKGAEVGLNTEMAEDIRHTSQPSVPEPTSPSPGDLTDLEAPETNAGTTAALLGPNTAFFLRERQSGAGDECRTVASSAFLVLAFVSLLLTLSARSTSSKSNAEAAATGMAGGRVTVAQTVLVSIDGFRHDFLVRKLHQSETYAAVTLRRLAKVGVWAHRGLQPIFPTKTFPNHQALATGLYAESSGIVSNTMHDPVTGRWFHKSSRDPVWWLGEPIWSTLRKANRTTGTVFWPGSDVAGRTADAFWIYNGSVSYEERVARVVSLLQGTAVDLLPLGRKADFVTLYLEGVDHACHLHGPESSEVSKQIALADNAIGDLLTRAPGINIIVVSDHGMTSISDKRVVDLNPGVSPGKTLMVVTTPLLMLANLASTAERVYTKLNSFLNGLPASHATAFRKSDLLERWHLKGSARVPDVLALADLGWTLKLTDSRNESSAMPERTQRLRAPNHAVRGNHGYDNIESEMQGLFVAAGPAFGDDMGRLVDRISATDVYLLVCNIFGAMPAPNNGSAAVVRHVLRSGQ
jgi:ectonucleotide pyrophosphatase/phosphodiesterase family member 5